jgi:uncharacterized protein (TIGR03083 family)
MAQINTEAAVRVAEREMLDEAGRFSALLRRVHGSVPVPGMRWSIGELGAHVVQSAVNAQAAVRGEASAYDGIGFSAEVDQRLVDALPERDTAVLAAMVDAEYGALAEQLRSRPDSELLGVIDRLTTASLRAILTLDFLLHGTQIARAAGESHPIDAETMRTCVAAVLPALALDQAGGGVSATFAVTFRGARPLLYGWEDGRLWVEDGREHRVDCRISADCAAFLLQGIGLIPTWKVALTRKAVATGRKPWLVLKLPRLVPAVPHGGVAD